MGEAGREGEVGFLGVGAAVAGGGIRGLFVGGVCVSGGEERRGGFGGVVVRHPIYYSHFSNLNSIIIR